MGSTNRAKLRCWALAGAIAVAIAAPAWAQETRRFNIPQQDLATALEAFGKQSGKEILFDRTQTRGKAAPAVDCDCAPAEALRRLLTGSGLAYRMANPDTYLVEPSSPFGAAAGDNSEAATYDFDIPSQDLGAALKKFVKASGQAVVFDRALVRGKVSVLLQGTHTADEGIEILLEQTGLAARRDPQGALVLEGASGLPGASSAQEGITTLDEIVVTGTNIRGVTNSASPISTYTRDDIDASGLGSVTAFIQALPENFKGGASEGTVGLIAGGGDSNNQVNGSGVNLRGLGNDSTLVLMNGRRLAPGNIAGNFIDVSLIPLAALERVDIMPDGASAIYGSDAVGGVINFIMRKDFEGAETRARYATVTEGGMHQGTVAQTNGFAWSGGSALLSYEYFHQSPLDLSEKSWVSNPQPGTFHVIPEQERHSVFMSANQAIGERFELFSDATYAKRDSHEILTTNTFRQDNRPAASSYSLTLGGRARLSESYELELASSYGASDAETSAFDVAGGRTAHGGTDTSVLTFDAKVTGPLWVLPGGPILFAAGAHHREESFSDRNLQTNSLRFKNDRNVWAGFAELRIPLLGPEAETSGPARLELNLANRYEHYSDFGSTSNPKLGLVWAPSPSIRLRGTWGTSFKAPLLRDLNPVPNQVVALPIFDPQAVPPGNVPAAFIFGNGNQNLGPEEATTWTLGFDLSPESIPGLKINTTYYDIRYTDRIATFFGSGLNVGFTDALRFEESAAPFIQRNPTAQELQTLIDASLAYLDFTGVPGGIDLATIAAAIDLRPINLATVETRGIDFGASYTTALGSGTFEGGIDGTYILEFSKQFVPTASPLELVNTIYNPVDLKLRARGLYQQGGLSISVFLNYVDSYKDERAAVSRDIKSWTTLDMNVGYEFDDSNGPLSGLSLSFGIINIADKAPPFVAVPSSPFPAVVFDGANANVLGRVVSIQAVKRW